MTEKKLEKIKKQLAHVIEELDAMSPSELEKAVVASEVSIGTAVKELEANDKYTAAKEVCKDLSSGLKDVRKYQGAKIAYALFRLSGDKLEA